MQSLLTIRDVKDILQVSESTVYRLADEGILQPVVIARRHRKRILRFKRETVERLIRQRENSK